jgi:diguanylate cyclase (GGDEF)-like protein/PAS domain S-box-containing protein
MGKRTQSEVRLVKQRSEHPGVLPGENFVFDPHATAADRLLRLAENVPGMLYMYRLRADGTSHFPFATSGIRDIYGLDPEDVVEDAIAVFDVLHPDDIEEIGRSIIESATALTPWSHTYRVCRPGGSVIWVRGHALPQRLEDGSTLWHGYIMDVTEAKDAEIALTQRERHLRAMFDAEPECVKVVSADGSLIDMNAAGLEMLEVDSLKEAQSVPLFQFLPPEYHEGYLAALHRALAGETLSYEFEIVGRLGTRRWMDTRMVPLTLEDGGASVLSITRDITDQKKLQHELIMAARTDKLTGLCNRSLLVERLQQRLDAAHSRTFALLFLDVDRFKLVNDSLGHGVGDQMLLEVATRLKRTVRSSDSITPQTAGNTVARLGGDEFVILLEDIALTEDAEHVAARILESLRKPYMLAGHRIITDASIGIVFGNETYERAEEVIRDADTAMYEAKRTGRGRSVVFVPAMRDRIQWLVALEDELRLALDHQEFRVLYQPIVDLESETVSGYEALVRWIHPVHGVVSPADFIPIAEDTGLILPLGDFVFRQAAMDARRWSDEGVHAYVSVNLSPHQLMEPVWISRFEDHLAISGLRASQVLLEITETTVMHDFDRAVEILSHLRAIGFRIALDDFGTGYSSLAWLHRLPIDVLKLDRTFVSQMQGQVVTLIRGLVATAHDLGIQVIAEGIETEEQQALLREVGCRFGQGYRFGRPQPAEDIRTHRAAA